ncbi:hypothetical protein A9267_02945 [Shewanella sp. UCD-FRSSP16_17]|uniref:DUF4381 domain-containing protein n=1 Tax=Shewanella TaxID=22 RepID=UPI0007EECA8A|nr:MULTISPECIES: DUF4381 domain-containing protein [Shewanella]MBQ4891613.1 DUF4381 domain-containing protein [Shewanella sp. MMG014]OBT11604.1 hypothetical protein A9267_02945 [Shewanella sp. UCD-FRSSP16_17]
MTQFGDTWGSSIVKDLIETDAPNAISWWPQTFGWQVVALIGLTLVCRRLYFAWRLYQHNQYRRDAIAWLNLLPPFEQLSAQPIYRQLPNLVRKTALGGYKRTEIATLSADEWTQWLSKQCPQAKFEDIGFTLHELAYDSALEVNTAQMTKLINQIRIWIEQHRGEYD